MSEVPLYKPVQICSGAWFFRIEQCLIRKVTILRQSCEQESRNENVSTVHLIAWPNTTRPVSREIECEGTRKSRRKREREVLKREDGNQG
jgi:hypothetical protein